MATKTRVKRTTARQIDANAPDKRIGQRGRSRLVPITGPRGSGVKLRTPGPGIQKVNLVRETSGGRFGPLKLINPKGTTGMFKPGVGKVHPWSTNSRSSVLGTEANLERDLPIYVEPTTTAPEPRVPDVTAASRYRVSTPRGR
jgi:hypothetical protein